MWCNVSSGSPGCLHVSILEADGTDCLLSCFYYLKLSSHTIYIPWGSSEHHSLKHQRCFWKGRGRDSRDEVSNATGRKKSPFIAIFSQKRAQPQAPSITFFSILDFQEMKLKFPTTLYVGRGNGSVLAAVWERRSLVIKVKEIWRDFAIRFLLVPTKLAHFWGKQWGEPVTAEGLQLGCFCYLP